MSRRRNTTARIYSGNKQRGSKRPSQSQLGTVDSVDETANQDEPAGPSTTLDAQILARQLEFEAMLRDSSEKRMASVVRRYFRVTLALAGINVGVAGATMFALWSRPDRSPTTVVNTRAAVQPSLPSPVAVPPAPSAAPPAPAPAPSPAQPPPSTVLPAPVSPKTVSKPAQQTALAEARRAAPRVRADRPQSNADTRKRAEEQKSLALDSVVERW
jgi:hypothetical protein